MGKVNIPEGKSGDWEINHFTVEQNDPKALYYALHGRPVPPGSYTRLLHNGSVIMSSTPAEMDDHKALFKNAHGKVLINGLGLGVVLVKLLSKNNCTSIDIVEVSEDVINLVKPYYPDPRITIYHADAFTVQWPKSKRWDIIWHDIWASICADNLSEMRRLRRKYAHRCNWQGFWCEQECRIQMRREATGGSVLSL